VTGGAVTRGAVTGGALGGGAVTGAAVTGGAVGAGAVDAGVVMGAWELLSALRFVVFLELDPAAAAMAIRMTTMAVGM
jgi:hypothetical protein